MFQSWSGFSPYFGGAQEGDWEPAVQFQSRSGFSPYFGPSVASLPATMEVMFQSRSGFSPYFGPALVTSPGEMDLFQSRSGFSPYFGCRSMESSAWGSWVSIPVWVFSLLRHSEGVGVLFGAEMFQSRSGFSPYFGSR